MSRAIKIASPRNPSITCWTTSDISACGGARRDTPSSSSSGTMPGCSMVHFRSAPRAGGTGGKAFGCRRSILLRRGSCAPGSNPFSGQALVLGSLSLQLGEVLPNLGPHSEGPVVVSSRLGGVDILAALRIALMSCRLHGLYRPFEVLESRNAGVWRKL